MKTLMSGRKSICVSLLLCFLALTAGCTPTEKTLLLETQVQDEIGETVESEEDFTVKKIYTYTYDVSWMLDKSASLEGCKEHEIRVIANGGAGSGGMPEGRLVDYRYGFYDLVGPGEISREEQTGSGMAEFWNLWPCEDPDEEAKEQPENPAYYVEQLQLSPDGTQMLVYAGAEDSDDRRVWLYDYKTAEPWLLYQGTRDDWSYPRGAFSPGGQWVTFDVAGDKSGNLVVIYDCHKERTADNGETDWIKLDGLSKIYAPDQTLYLSRNGYTKVWTAEIFEISGYPGVVSILENKEFSPEAFESYNLGEGYGTGHFMSQYYLRGDLAGTMLYLRYELDMEENRLYYMENFRRLWSIDMVQGDTAEVGNFADSVLDFRRLDSGEILALTTQESLEKYVMNMGYLEYSVNSLPEAQNFWDIRSVDLYLYTPDGTDGQLLYKNLQHVINMEYDAGTRRILLETYEDASQTSRKCIVLEL